MAHPLAPTPEQESLRALRALIIDLYERGNAETTRRLPMIGYRVANSSAERRSERLLQNALDIWLMEIALLGRAKEEVVRRGVAELVAETSYYVILGFAGQMEDPYRPLAERLAASPFLRRLARFEAEVLKMHIERRDRESFDEAYLRWTDAWFRHWSPEHDLDELRHFAPGSDREGAQRLETSRRLVDAKAEALRGHTRGLLELGAWVAYERRRDRMDAGDFAFFSRFLIGVVSTFTAVVDELASIASGGWDSSLLERWDLVNARPGSSQRVMTGWVGGGELVRFWLTLLLARFAPSAESEHRPEGLPDSFVQDVRNDLQAIDDDWSRWEEVVGDRTKLAGVRAWLDEEERRGREAGRIQIAEAPLDDDRIASFVAAEVDGFVRESLVRERLISRGAYRVDPSSDPDRGVRRFPFRRDVFVKGGPMLVGERDLGSDLGRQLEQDVYLALAQAIGPGRGIEPVDSVIAAVDDLAAAGSTPDLILAPATVYVRPLLARHPRFRWRHPDLVDDRGAMGYIDELPVFDVGPPTADQLLVVDLKKAITLIERRPPSGPPLGVTVTGYERSQADQLVAGGFRFSDQPEWSAERIAEFLVDNFVEVTVRLDYEIEVSEKAAAAGRRIHVSLERERGD